MGYIDTLIAEVREGRLEQVEERLPNVPADKRQARAALKKIVEFFELVWGAKLEAGDESPVIFGGDWVGKRVELHQTVVSRWLLRLVEWGSLEHVASMLVPGVPGREGARLYLPGQPVAFPEPAGTVETVVGAPDAPEAPAAAKPHPEAEDVSAVVTAVFGEDGVPLDSPGRLSALEGETGLRDSGFHGPILPAEDDDEPGDEDEELDDYELDLIERFERGELAA